MASLPLYTPTPSLLTRKPNPKLPFPSTLHATTSSSSSSSSSSSCKASSSLTDFDLYDLLGIDNTSDQAQIKTAYRSLQKRCHPDIAGPTGHDMAIILNEAYALLSDPNSRSAYDYEQAKVSDIRGYTGKPLYSVWFGSESEQRAVFVDEVKCIGCLKCALFAKKTFAIESVYGRARVVGQWADPEHKIQEAIETCPVDCISMVERSNLAALEFLMSKQPRDNVRSSSGSSGGKRVANIFVDVKKFQTKFHNAMDKASSTQQFSESNLQREARISAIQAIRSISNWLYWHPGAATPESPRNLRHLPEKSSSGGPDINKLRDTAAAIKHARENPSNTIQNFDSEYWVPSTLRLPSSTPQTEHESQTQARSTDTKRLSQDVSKETRKTHQRNPLRYGFAAGVAMIGAGIVRLQVREVSVGEVKDHMGGSFALEIVNSSWLQDILAGFTWFLVGMIMVDLVGLVLNKQGDHEN